ncbi:MAG: type VI secretion system baseplate subunit TssK [Planctomycetota bacterium]|jgi:type VI secretion system protein ImpJ
MAPSGLVHWYEGQFLEPHHMQMMQRRSAEELSFERRLTRCHPYGLLDCEVSEDDLANMRVRFRRLLAVMPSGVVVDVPRNADPPSLSIGETYREGDAPLTVCLGVPLWYGDRANSVEADVPNPWTFSCIYRVQEVESADENTGENVKPVQVRRINARLLLEGDDRADLEILPVLRIHRAAGDEGGRPEADKSFIPPCFALSGSSVLSGTVQDLTNQVEANRRELVAQLSRGSFSVDTIRGVQIEQLLRLKTLNRFSARLSGMLTAPGLSPFDVYLELAGLLGELAALQPDRDPFEVPAYDHDSLGDVFPALCEAIRLLLRGPVAARFLRETFALDPDKRAFVASITDEELSLANEYYLAVKTREDPRALATLAEDPDRFKLLPLSRAKRRVRGLRLAEERHPPLEFPAEVGLHYFRIMRDKTPKIWEQIVREKAIAATWRGVEASEFSLTLCMTVPEEGA